MWSKTAAVAGCLGAVLVASTAGAAEINVIASTAMRETPLPELARSTTSPPVTFAFTMLSALRR